MQIKVRGVLLRNKDPNSRESREARAALKIKPLENYRNQLPNHERDGRLVPVREIRSDCALQEAPSWIGCMGDPEYAGRVIRRCFPGVIDPRKASQTCYGTPLPVLLCDIWDLGGLVGIEEELDNFVLISAL